MLTASAPIVTIALAPTIAANSFVAVFRLFESIVKLHFMAVARFAPAVRRTVKVQVKPSELAVSVARLKTG
jgi:hypothetical protein